MSGVGSRPPVGPTGHSGQFSATLEASRIPAAVAMLVHERTNNEDWKGRHSQRMANAEAEIDHLQRLRADEKLMMELRFADIIQRITVAEAKVKSFMATMVGVWAVVTAVIGIWISLAK